MDMLKDLKLFHIILLLFAVTFGLYYYSLLDAFYKQSILSLDDAQFMSYLANNELQLRQVLSPTWDGKYYRPVVGVSYLLDQRLYGDDPFGYRFTNVLIHAFNVILLYLTSRKILKSTLWKKEVSFFAALIFSVHPIAVESISWISGRADPLAVFWSLLALLSYLMSKERGSYALAFLSILSMTLAILSKETALATPLLIAAFELFYGPGFAYRRSKYAVPLFVLLLFAGPLYMKLRSGTIFSEDLSLSILRDQFLTGSIASKLEMVLASVGFYFKKFIFPFPLNFAIHTINTKVYALIGALILSLFVLTLNLKKFRIYHFFLFWALIGVGPAAVVSFTHIAWTPWAERHVYFAAVPLSIGVMLLIFSSLESIIKEKGSKVYAVIFSIIFCFSGASWQRSLVMNDNEKIFEDSYRKSPNFLSVAVIYAGALMKKGKMAEAEDVLLKSKSLSGAKHTLLFSLGQIYGQRGEYEEAEDAFNKAYDIAKKDKSLVSVGAGFRKDIMTALGTVELQRAASSTNDEEIKAHYLKAIENFRRATEEAMEPFTLYKIANLYMKIEDQNMAAFYLQEFIKRGKDDHYRESARKILRRIENDEKIE